MLTLPPSVRVFLAVGATDLRRSIDGLAALVRERLRLEPLSGHLFLFRNRRGDRLKILVWDRSGFWVGVLGALQASRAGDLRVAELGGDGASGDAGS